LLIEVDTAALAARFELNVMLPDRVIINHNLPYQTPGAKEKFQKKSAWTFSFSL